MNTPIQKYLPEKRGNLSEIQGVGRHPEKGEILGNTKGVEIHKIYMYSIVV